MLVVFLLAFFLGFLVPLACSVRPPDENTPDAVASSPDFKLSARQDSSPPAALDDVDSLLLAPGQVIAGITADLDPTPTAVDAPSSAPSTPPDPEPTPPPSSEVQTPSTEAPQGPVTVTETEVTTDTLTLPTIVTVIASTTSPSPTSTSTTAAPSGAVSAWAAPTQMHDLSSFNISVFPNGQHNLHLVQGIPSEASATADLLDSILQPTTAPSYYKPWTNRSTVMQLAYPAGSANPKASPVGGAEFYAQPLDIANAESVSMEYSVFFPRDFDWVLGGKLPGLYGGRRSCSGGDAATDCFSTRLMWRDHGAGELYLYAPKDKQTAAMCNDPQSDCNAAYGFSIGRGSFHWAPGSWTTVQQTVQLNNPGKQDGVFVLSVNGKVVIQRNDVFYRDVSGGSKSRPSPPPSASPTPADPLGGLLPPLGPIVGGLLGRQESDAAAPPPAEAWMMLLGPGETTFVPRETATSTTLVTVQAYPTSLPLIEEAAVAGPPGFIGIFFSTFFGGHGKEWQTPEDQNTWFKDFDLVYNH